MPASFDSYVTSLDEFPNYKVPLAGTGHRPGDNVRVVSEPQ